MRIVTAAIIGVLFCSGCDLKHQGAAVKVAGCVLKDKRLSLVLTDLDGAKSYFVGLKRRLAKREPGSIEEAGQIVDAIVTCF